LKAVIHLEDLGRNGKKTARVYLEELDGDGKTIKKLYNREGLREAERTGLIWLRIGKNGGLFWTR